MLQEPHACRSVSDLTAQWGPFTTRHGRCQLGHTAIWHPLGTGQIEQLGSSLLTGLQSRCQLLLTWLQGFDTAQIGTSHKVTLLHEDLQQLLLG